MRSGGDRVRSTEIVKVFGAFLVVLMDLEAQTLSELRSFYVLSIYIGFGSRFYIKIMDLLAREGSMLDDFVAENID